MSKRSLGLLLGTLSWSIAGGAAAQEVGETADVITVEAPRSVPAPVERSPYTGVAVAITTVRMPVLYGDLDLSAPGDAERLMVRIRNVARDVCRELDRLHPLNPDGDCAVRAAPKGDSVGADGDRSGSAWRGRP
ncbi:MAG: UrcA family protein [Sphingobium sp.]|uniref:UrcA family protein n=1 Tax=Sphingobium sp. TaxID=1912891 RepID=UPI0029A17E21|nr:UrcA family protein [Sphingobium sp.]MDX3911166.1 UrcA family protein [Sphingobium sp.]